MEITVVSTEETKKLAEKLAAKVNSGDVIKLYGDLGSGKTTFVRYLVAALGIEARVQSPTFVIMRRYTDSGKSGIKTVNHIDLYRMQSEEEVEELGLNEIISENPGITVIEWPELAERFLPDNTIMLFFEDAGETVRKIKLENIEL